MPRNHTHLSWEEQIVRRRETMDPYYGVVVSNALYIERKEMKEQKDIQRRVHSGPYNFLQYVGVVFRWACLEYDIRRRDLDFLLYIYPILLFTTKEFRKLEKQFGTHDFKRWDRFRKKGYVVEHSKHFIGENRKGGPRSVVWTISHKYGRLVTAIHKKLLFLEPLPTDKKSLPKLRKEFHDYDSLLQDFNEKVRQKADEKSA